MKRSILLAGIGALLLQTSAQAVPDYGFFTTFDQRPNNNTLSNWVKLQDGTYTQDGGLTTKASLSAADLVSPYSWITTDSYQNDIASSTLWPGYVGDKSAGMGAFGAPSAAQVELWTPVQASNVTFKVLFGITKSSAGAPTQDDFAWTFRDTAGNQIFALRFKPVQYDEATTTITGGTDYNYYEIFTENAAGVDTPAYQVFQMGSEYALSLTTELHTHDYTATVTPVHANGTAIAGLGSISFGDNTLAAGDETKIGAVAATWILNDPQLVDGAPTNAGDNLLIMNNYQEIGRAHV